MIWAFAGLYSRADRARVAVVTLDCHNSYRMIGRLAFPHALIVADAFHLHRLALDALTKVRRSAVHRIAHTRHARAMQPKAAGHALARARDELEADTSERGA